MDCDVTYFAEEVERLAPLVAPLDFAEHPLICEAQADLPDRFHASGTCGFTVGWLDLSLREHRIAKGRWPGRRCYAIIVCETNWLNFAGTALHEMAHCLSHRGSDEFWRMEPNDEPLDSTLNEAIRMDYRASRDSSDFPSPPCWGHEAPWIRDALHVQFRARRIGLGESAKRMGICHYPELMPEWYYEEALGDEPERWLDRPLVDLADEPLPAAFAELWRSDMAKHGIDVNEGAMDEGQ